MTDLGRFQAMRKAYVYRMSTVCTFLALLVAGSAAQAGAWEEFEARCLVPMENVALTQPRDLTPKARFKNDGDTFSRYVFDGAKLSVSDGRDGRPVWCAMSTVVPESLDFGKQAQAWGDAVVADGRYAVLEEYVLGYHLRSTEWREPRIDVKLTMSGKGSQFHMRVEETDLES